MRKSALGGVLGPIIFSTVVIVAASFLLGVSRGWASRENVVKVLELKVPPAVLVALIAATMWAVSRISPNLYFTIPGAAWWSAGIAAVGVCIAVLGVLEFRVAGTTVDPRVPDQSVTLVVRGIYRHSRNPMYLGFFLVLFAWGLFLGSALSLVFLPAFIAYMNCFQIVPEERFMREKFGESYNKYRSEVRRWV